MTLHLIDDSSANDEQSIPGRKVERVVPTGLERFRNRYNVQSNQSKRNDRVQNGSGRSRYTPSNEEVDAVLDVVQREAAVLTANEIKQQARERKAVELNTTALRSVLALLLRQKELRKIHSGKRSIAYTSSKGSLH